MAYVGMREDTCDAIAAKILKLEEAIAEEKNEKEKEALRKDKKALRKKEKDLRRENILQLENGGPAKRRRTCDNSTKIPSALSVPASAASKNPREYILPSRTEVPLFSHWFAMDVYDIYSRDLCLTADTIQLKIGERSYFLQTSTLTRCANDFSNIAGFCSKDIRRDSFLSNETRSHEDTFSSLITPVLAKLIGAEGTVFNQLVIRVRGSDIRCYDKPDHIVAKTVNGIPTVCVLVSDSKKTSDKGKYQVHAYGLALERSYLFLGLTITHTKINLSLYIPYMGKFSVIDICSTSCIDVDNLKRFFCALYVAVQRLLDDPISGLLEHHLTLNCCGEYLNGFDDKHRNLGHHTSSNIEGSVVVHCTCTNKVKKYYDTAYHYLPTKEAIGFIRTAEMLRPPDSRYQILQYTYMEGCHVLKTPLQVVAAVKELKKFHDADFVHGDIRSINMIVSENTVRFIDVDLAKKEGENYPSTYNHSQIPERHKDAQKNREMKKIHDRYALYQIINMSEELRNNEVEVVEQLLNIATPLVEIANQLEQESSVNMES